MGALILDRVASVWRTGVDPTNPSGYALTEVYSAIPCAIIPVSQADAQVQYALQSTHLIWAPRWLQVRKEDEVHYGRALPNAFGEVLPLIYVINGRREISQGVSQVVYWATERE